MVEQNIVSNTAQIIAITIVILALIYLIYFLIKKRYLENLSRNFRVESPSHQTTHDFISTPYRPTRPPPVHLASRRIPSPSTPIPLETFSSSYWSESSVETA